MEANNISHNDTNKHSLDLETNNMVYSLPKRDLGSCLEDFAKKSIYSSYRSRTDKLETVGFHKKSNHDFDTCSEKQTSKRALSVKASLIQKPSFRQIVMDKKNTNDYTENLFKLKLQEMTFKFKTKIATILKEIDIPINQFSRFTTLNRIDELLEFLADNIKNRLSHSQASKAQNIKTLSKERQLLSDYQQQIQLLKKKQTEKDGVQRIYKAKLKQSHNQIRDLYDKINQKERELSQKMTEIYQLRSLSKQSDKLIENYKLKCLTFQRELSQQSSKQGMEIKKIISSYKNIEEQNQQLRQKNQELAQIIQSQQQKEVKILELNQHLSQQLERWKERFQSDMMGQVRNENQESVKSTQKLSVNEANPLSGKLSTLTLQNQISRLNYKVKDLQKQNRNLTRELVNHQSIKDKYEQLLACISTAERMQSKQYTQPNAFISQKWRQMVGEQQLFQVQYFYKKKIEEIVKQWRDKLIEVISKTEEDEEKLKKYVMKLEKTNEELQSKVYQLANEKYVIQNKLIEKERQVYQMSKTKKTKRNSFYTHSAEHETKSEVLRSREGETNNEESGIESIDEKHV